MANFCDFEILKFLRPKNVSFLSRTLLNIICSIILTEINKEKKNDQKHGLTPLEKCSFWDFKRLNLVWAKEVSFLYRTLLNIISSFILTENLTKEKKF